MYGLRVADADLLYRQNETFPIVVGIIYVYFMNERICYVKSYSKSHLHNIMTLLYCYIVHLMVMSTGEWLRIGEQCQMDVESIPVANLQARLWSPPASIEQRKILDVFAVLFDEKCTCGILSKIWDAVCPAVVSSPSVLTADIWPKFTAELDRVSNDLVNLNIRCADAASLLHSQLAIEELKLLEQVLHNSHLFTPPRHFSPCKVRDKLLLFETVKEVQKGARNFLELKTSIGFTGDFTAVENIARVSKTPVTLIWKHAHLTLHFYVYTFCSLLKSLVDYHYAPLMLMVHSRKLWIF